MIQLFRSAIIAASLLFCSNFSHAQTTDSDPSPPHSGFRHAIAVTPIPFVTNGVVGAVYMKEKARSGLRIGISGSHSIAVDDLDVASGCNALEFTRQTQSSFSTTVNWLKWKHYEWVSLYYGGGLGGGFLQTGTKLLRPGELCDGLDFAILENNNISRNLSVGGQGLVGVRFLFGNHFSLMADITPVSLRSQFGWSRSRTVSTERGGGDEIVSEYDRYQFSNNFDFFSRPSLWLGIHF